MTAPKLKLVIGDKNLSSWSLRAWLVAEHSGLSYEEVLVRLDRQETPANLQMHSPSKKVPCLIHGELKIWDSLAICEYIAELAPHKELWPGDAPLRALARAYVAEMHSGFSSLREQLSMDIRLRIKVRHLTPQTTADIERIRFLWQSALEKSAGPFLFGPFGIADAFFTPVVFRFQSYGIELQSEKLRQYMKQILSDPAVKAWTDAALLEQAPELSF